MSLFVFLWSINLIIVALRTCTGATDGSSENAVDRNVKVVGLSKMFNYPDDERFYYASNNGNEYHLRFDPASLRQGLPAPGGSNVPPPGGLPAPGNIPQVGIPPGGQLPGGQLPGGQLPAGQLPFPNNLPGGQLPFPNNPGLPIGPNLQTGNQFPNQPFPGFPRPGLPQNQTLLLGNFPIQPIRPTFYPQRFPGMFSQMGNRVKNLIFGDGSFLKRPESSRGFLNLFDIIKFRNEPCSASLNRIRLVNGTCFYKTECEQRGGVAAGICAEGYGVCCVFRYGCGALTKEEITYLESPNYPLAFSEPLTCTFTIFLEPHIQQVKLDLLFFEIKQPLAGNCIEDQFVVSGQNRNTFVPILCGVNSGQHMYIDVDYSLERKLILSFIGRSTGARAFSIRVHQLWHTLAPRFCLQFHTEPVGFIKSFNYENVGSIVEARTPSYLNNLNYDICIKRQLDRCTITYTNQAPEGALQFQLINVNRQFIPLVPPNQAGAEVFNCPDDYIVINNVRLCGDRLNDGSLSQNFLENAPVTSFGSGPIIVPFRSDENFVGRGFKLLYTQNSCE